MRCYRSERACGSQIKLSDCPRTRQVSLMTGRYQQVRGVIHNAQLIGRCHHRSCGLATIATLRQRCSRMAPRRENSPFARQKPVTPMFQRAWRKVNRVLLAFPVLTRVVGVLVCAVVLIASACQSSAVGQPQRTTLRSRPVRMQRRKRARRQPPSPVSRQRRFHRPPHFRQLPRCRLQPR